MKLGNNSNAVPLQVEAVNVDIAGRRILHEVSLSVDGDVLGLVGPNGSGKSTLLRTVYRMLRPATGCVTAGGRDVWAIPAREAARITAALVQDAPSDLDLTVAECVATGRVPHGRLLGADTAADRAAVIHAMNDVGIENYADRDVSTLSGGERQRVQLARALAQDPSILVLDEPTNDLDTDMLAAMEDLLDSWPGTLLVVSHDRYFLERVTDQQYAILDHKLRHLPGGVDQYLELRAAEEAAAEAGGSQPAAAKQTVKVEPKISGAERRTAEKERSAAERKIAKLQKEVEQTRDGLATLDQGNFELLNAEMSKISAAEAEIEALELRWLELEELLG